MVPRFQKDFKPSMLASVQCADRNFHIAAGPGAPKNLNTFLNLFAVRPAR